MTDQRAQAFADALIALETDGDVDRFVTAQFTDDVVLLRPETGQQVTGTEGATDYWQQYLAEFEQVRSTFDRIVGGDTLGVLEWTGTGRLRNGAEISYRGVSVLDYDGDGKVSRFATYYDTAAFTAHAVLHQPH